MKIVQLVPSLSYGDAVGNDILAIDSILKKEDIETTIYALSIGARIPDGLAKVYSFDELQGLLKPEDILLYHGATGTQLHQDIPKFHCKKLLRYHNVTPPQFFEGYSESGVETCREGLKEFEEMKDVFDGVVTVSSFNVEDLQSMGYRCRMDVCPILIPFSDYDQCPNGDIMRTYQDGVTNILFVGRIAPNKKHEDIIASFAAYNKLYNPNSRLIFVGAANGTESYKKRLEDYSKVLGISNQVVFSGHIGFDGILAFYSVADLFLCLSEHEGFCVPLIEAMYFKTPIVAFDSSAIAGTLQDGGILIQKKDPSYVAGIMDYVIQHPDVQEAIVKGQQRRLSELSHDKVASQILEVLHSYMK